MLHWIDVTLHRFQLLLRQVHEAGVALGEHEVVPHLLTAAEAARLALDHAGIQVAYGSVADAAWRATIAAWYRDIHAPDVIGVDGVIGCVRFVSRDQSEPRACRGQSSAERVHVRGGEVGCQ